MGGDRWALCARSTGRATLVCLIAAAMVSGAPAVPAVADEIRDRQWHLDYLDIVEVHELARGEGVIVAVVDSGVDGTHPDLAGNVMDGVDLTDSLRDNGWNDWSGHGTAMASLIAGRGHGPGGRAGILGIAPRAKILPIKDGDGEDTVPDDMAEGIRWAVDNGADVINLSGGYPARGSRALRDAVAAAIRKDIVVVAAAGNLSEGDRKVLAPANYEGVVAVSATDRDAGLSAESFRDSRIVLTAPGAGITASDPSVDTGYSIATGTSNSTAIVSGVAALIRSEYPDLNAASVIQRVIATADDKGVDGRDNRYGFGIVNPVKALTADIEPVERNPLLPPLATRSAGSEAAEPDGVPVGYLLVGLGAFLLVTLLVLATWWAARSRHTRI